MSGILTATSTVVLTYQLYMTNLWTVTFSNIWNRTLYGAI